ncbi:MAG: sialidase family protein [Candidatus Brocadiia bacterium]
MAASGNGRAQAKVRDEHVVVHRDEWAYIPHPCIAMAPNGDWLDAFKHTRRRGHILHPPDDPLYRTLVCRSVDQGHTWEQPHFAPHFNFSGTECPEIAATSGGRVLLTEFRRKWYPIGLAPQKREEGEPVEIKLPDRGWTGDFTPDDLDAALFTWARGGGETCAHVSEDNGLSFPRTIQIDCSPYPAGYSRTGVVELADGRLAYAMQASWADGPNRIFVVTSGDGGDSWSEPVQIVESTDQAFAEPDLGYPVSIEYAPGRIFCCYYGQDEAGITYVQGSYVDLL